MLVKVKQPHNRIVEYHVFNNLPKVGDKWFSYDYGESYIFYIRCINDQITADNRTYDYNFYDVYIEMDEDTFIEHICVRKE